MGKHGSFSLLCDAAPGRKGVGVRFMIEEIATDLYKVEVPLPDNLLRSVNSYIVKGSERDLIIDPGMNREECLNVMRTSLKELKVDLRETDFFITHSHVDHFSLVLNLATEESTIYFNRPDMDIVDRIRQWHLSGGHNPSHLL